MIIFEDYALYINMTKEQADSLPLRFYKNILKIGGGSSPSWQDIVLSGNGSLTLTNAKQNGLNYVKLLGACSQADTPTPTTPVDIVCNNGAIKYSPNELNPDDIVIGYYRVQATGVLTESPYNFVTGYMPVKGGQSYVFYGRRIEDNRLSSYNRIHWFDEDKEFISTNSYNKDTIGVGTAPVNAVYAQCSCNESGATSRETTQEIVDGYNWVFELATAEVTYIPYASESGLYIDGTVETVQVHGINIFNKNDTENIGNWYVGTNQTIMIANANETIVMRAKPNTTYYFKHCSVKGGCRSFYTEVEDWEVGSACSTMSGNAGGNVNVVYSITTSANAKWIFFNYGRSNLEASFDDQRNDFMVSTSELTVSSTYEPYYNGGTATATDLYAVGDYKDVQSVLDGAVTRNVGVKVLDGTENWVFQTSLLNYMYSLRVSDLYAEASNVTTNRQTPYCTHFTRSTSWVTGTDRTGVAQAYQPASGDAVLGLGYGTPSSANLNDFKTWLATQYAQGTPVIVVYPLATATTESVTGQTLTTQSGTNIIEITQASINNLPLEVSYKGTI